MRRLSGTTRRLLLAFGALIALFAVASAVALAGMRDLDRTVAGIKQHAARVRLTLELSRAMRDRYAHVAHTIILGNASHVPMYERARARVLELSRELDGSVQSAKDRAAMQQIDAANATFDTLFLQGILPAVLRHDQATVDADHEQLLALVSHLEGLSDGLATRAWQEIERFDAHARRVHERTLALTVTLLASAILFAAGVGLYIGRSVARPVAVLEAGAAKLGAGDLKTRIPITRDDEFGHLATSFNDMASALAKHQEQLVQSERLAGIGRLAAGVAHEINNPLGVILGYTRLLLRQADEATAADLHVIEDEVLRAQEIVEGLLDLSRPMSGEDDVSLRELCEGISERLAETTALDGVEVKLSGEAHAPGNGRSLRQVVMNLVRNAAEAAGPGGEVEVTLSEDKSSAQLRVADSGPGIAPDARARLFEPFFTTKAAGTGLGLAVAHAIVRAHGGSIEVGGGTPGGAVFTVTLPKHERRSAVSAY